MRKINYSLFISDFDGTLVNGDGTISVENKAAIAQFIEDGGAFAISTGRMPAGILSRAKELGLKGMLSCCQGAIIIDLESGKTVLEGSIPYETTYKVVKKMEEMGLHIHVYDFWDYYSNMDDELLMYYEKAVGSKAKVISDKPLSEFVKERKLASYKILAMVLPEDNQRVLQALSREDFDGCGVTRSASILVEVVSTQYSKGTAVEFLANYYGIPVEKTVGMGDQLNDIPMLERAGLGIAVSNADEALKAAADYVSEYTNEQCAVKHAIEKYGYEEE